MENHFSKENKTKIINNEGKLGKGMEENDLYTVYVVS